MLWVKETFWREPGENPQVRKRIGGMGSILYWVTPPILEDRDPSGCCSPCFSPEVLNWKAPGQENACSWEVPKGTLS